MNSRRGTTLLFGAWLSMVSISVSWASPRVEPSQAALDLVRTLSARSMGVDRAGNLWVWSAQGSAVDLVSPQGGRLEHARMEGARALDVDASWGIAALVEGGRDLQWRRWDGSLAAEISLPGPAAGICWIGSGRVAISPQLAPHRIEIWDLLEKTLTRDLGDETPLSLGPGATRLRAVVLRYDFERNLLFSLESFTGDLQVFSVADGRLDWRGQVENIERPELEAWLRKVDEQAKASSSVQTPTLFSLNLAVDSDGAAWVVQDRDEATGEVKLARLVKGGTTIRISRGENCASYSPLIWGSALLFYRGLPSGEVCRERRLP